MYQVLGNSSNSGGKQPTGQDELSDEIRLRIFGGDGLKPPILLNLQVNCGL